MGLFLNPGWQPSNLTLGIMVLAILILTLLSTVFSGVLLGKAGTTTRESFGPYVDTGASRYVAFSGRTTPGAEGFLGRPEAPVFYELGDSELIRSNRRGEKPEGFSATDYSLMHKKESFGESDLANKLY